MAKQHRIQREDGTIKPDYSGYCPTCMHPEVEKEQGGADFDEKGWFYPTVFICKNPKCKHTWTESYRISQ